jgi:hypothetical protein
MDYDCCLQPNQPGKCTKNNTPDQIHDASCNAQWVAYCSPSKNITKNECLNFIHNMNQAQSPMSNMDDQVESFCAMNREEKDPFFKQCACVNLQNTCAGRTILKEKAGSPACYFEQCKSGDHDMFVTSEMHPSKCNVVDCSIKDISISNSGPINIKNACSSSTITNKK